MEEELSTAEDAESHFLVKESPADDQLPCASSPSIKVEYVNGEYFVYDRTDANVMKRNYRIVPEAIGTDPMAPCDPVNCGPPFVLLPEQAMVLKEFGYARIVHLRTELPETSCDVASSVQGAAISDISTEESRELAVKIAKGRKAKALKRELNQISTAAELRIRSCDLSSIEVTEEEVDAVIKEQLAEKTAYTSNILKVPLSDLDESGYEEVDSESLQITPVLRIRLTVFRDLWRRGYYMTDGLKFGCDYLLYEGIPGEVHAKYLVRCVNSLNSLCPLDLAALSRVGSQVKKAIILAVVAPDSVKPYYIYMSWWRS